MIETIYLTNCIQESKLMLGICLGIIFGLAIGRILK